MHVVVAAVLFCILAFSLRPGLGLAMLPSDCPSSCLTWAGIMEVQHHIRSENVCFQQLHRRWLTWGEQRGFEMAYLYLQANYTIPNPALLASLWKRSGSGIAQRGIWNSAQ